MPIEGAPGGSRRTWRTNDRSRAVLLGAVLVGVATVALDSTALARLGLSFETPSRLAVGDRARVVLVVDVPEDMPVLVTPTHEGSAVEVVRGRLARVDALEPEARPLRFPIPIVARERGAGAVRATVSTFECAGDDCVALEEEARITLRVEPR